MKRMLFFLLVVCLAGCSSDEDFLSNSTWEGVAPVTGSRVILHFKNDTKCAYGIWNEVVGDMIVITDFIYKYDPPNIYFSPITPNMAALTGTIDGDKLILTRNDNNDHMGNFYRK